MNRSILTKLVPAFCVVVLIVLYAPLIPPFFKSLEASEGLSVWEHYSALGEDFVISEAVKRSLQLAITVGIITAVLALLAGLAVRRSRVPRLLVIAILMPLFVPGVSAGLSSAMFFKYIGLEPSMLSMVLVQIGYCLPFAFLIVITSMSTFEQRLIEAAYMCGASPTRAFRTVELPLIRSGVTGAAVFSMVLSLNETIRTSLVQGPFNTIQTYIWATYLDVGINARLYALMAILIVVTVVILAACVVALSVRGKRSAERESAAPAPSTQKG